MNQTYRMPRFTPQMALDRALDCDKPQVQPGLRGARDAGTHEGAVKAAATRKSHGFASGSELARNLKAPSNVSIFKEGGAHGGGSVGYNVTGPSHADIHASLENEGFVRQKKKSSKSKSNPSTVIRHSEYIHPEGHTAFVKTNIPKYKQSDSYVHVNMKKN